MKKSIFRYILTGSLAVAAPLSSCDRGFDELNVNRTAPTALNPVHLLNRAIISTSFPGFNVLVYESSIVQHTVTPNSGVLAGGNFNQSNRDITRGMWQRYYRDVMRHVVDALDKTRDDPARANLYQMARIWRCYTGMILTDTYGDVPYSQAGLGYLEFNQAPVFDSQESIYNSILTELDEAATALTPGRTPVETGDVLYSGDVVKWKRLAYSLMLRAAMRLTKVDPAKAQAYAAKAVAGGVMQSNADNAAIRHNNDYTNETGNTLNGSERSNIFLAAPFVDYLKANNDPRLAAIAARVPGATSGSDQNDAYGGTKLTVDRTPANQVGMPMGYDNGSIVAVAKTAGLPSFYAYSQIDRSRMGGRFVPVFLVTAAQTKLLLAEAVVRGWTTGDAAALYKAAIEDHMKELTAYGPATAIAQADIDAYTAANPLDPARALEQINTQYWVASFLNAPEAFANFRRSGYPALAPNPYPGKEISGQFIRRLLYPDSELSVNNASVQEAITRQGPDNLDTRVWWDR